MISDTSKERANEFQSQSNLGKLLKVYRGHPIRTSEIIIFGLLIFGAVVGPLGYGIWRLIYGYTHFGPTSANSWSRPWFITAAIAATLILFLLIRRVWVARLAVGLHENGIAVIRPLKKRNTEIQWSDISSINSTSVQERFLGLTYANSNKISLQFLDQRRCHIDGKIQSLVELTDRIKNAIYPQLLRKYRGNISIGQPVNFGKIHLSTNGLHFAGNDIHWNSIQHVGLDSGSLVIELTNTRIQRFAAASIPNIEILLQLIEEITKE